MLLVITVKMMRLIKVTVSRRDTRFVDKRFVDHICPIGATPNNYELI